MIQLLPKKRFYAELTRRLVADGWTHLEDKTDLSALLGRRVGEYIACVGLIESGRGGVRVTADLSLARHTFLLLGFPDTPHARQRVGRFLTDEERTRLLSARYCRPGVRDAWWEGRTIENVGKIVEAVGTATPRFLAQPRLMEELDESREQAEYFAQLQKIASTPHAGRPPEGAAPQEWRDAAFALLSDAASSNRVRFAEHVALDAWRTFVVLPAPGVHD